MLFTLRLCTAPLYIYKTNTRLFFSFGSLMFYLCCVHMRDAWIHVFVLSLLVYLVCLCICVECGFYLTILSLVRTLLTKCEFQQRCTTSLTLNFLPISPFSQIGSDIFSGYCVEPRIQTADTQLIIKINYTNQQFVETWAIVKFQIVRKDNNYATVKHLANK